MLLDRQDQNLPRNAERSSGAESDHPSLSTLFLCLSCKRRRLSLGSSCRFSESRSYSSFSIDERETVGARDFSIISWSHSLSRSRLLISSRSRRIVC